MKKRKTIISKFALFSLEETAFFLNTHYIPGLSKFQKKAVRILHHDANELRGLIGEPPKRYKQIRHRKVFWEKPYKKTRRRKVIEE